VKRGREEPEKMKNEPEYKRAIEKTRDGEREKEEEEERERGRKETFARVVEAIVPMCVAKFRVELSLT